MSGYTKLFSSILMSSVWEEPADTRIVWVTLLALADQHGHVDGTVKSLARVSRVSLTACQRALETFLGPDPADRSGVAEGRRIRPEKGGWLVVNHAAYRERMSEDERRERDRLRKREKRAMSAASPQVSEFVRDVSQAEAEADTKERTTPDADAPAEVVASPSAAEKKQAALKLKAEFSTFWQHYPRKDDKKSALAAWLSLKPSVETQRAILADLARRSQDPEWTKDNGTFIPYAVRYLKKERWTDGIRSPSRAFEAPAAHRPAPYQDLVFGQAVNN